MQSGSGGRIRATSNPHSSREREALELEDRRDDALTVAVRDLHEREAHVVLGDATLRKRGRLDDLVLARELELDVVLLVDPHTAGNGRAEPAGAQVERRRLEHLLMLVVELQRRHHIDAHVLATLLLAHGTSASATPIGLAGRSRAPSARNDSGQPVASDRPTAPPGRLTSVC